MTGLNLETFLHLLRADLGAWASLGVIALLLALMAWTSWGSRRALRKCLVLSVVAHVGLALYGSTYPIVGLSASTIRGAEPAEDRIRQIRVTPQRDGSGDRPGPRPAGDRAGTWPPGISPARPWRWPTRRSCRTIRSPRVPSSCGAPRRPPRPPRRPPRRSIRPSPPPRKTGPTPRRTETPPPAPPAVAPGSPDEVAAARVERGGAEASAPVPDRGRLRLDRGGPEARRPRSPGWHRPRPPCRRPPLPRRPRRRRARRPGPIRVGPSAGWAIGRLGRSGRRARGGPIGARGPGAGRAGRRGSPRAHPPAGGRGREGRSPAARGRPGVVPACDPPAPAPAPGVMDGPLGGGLALASERPEGPRGGRRRTAAPGWPASRTRREA